MQKQKQKRKQKRKQKKPILESWWNHRIVGEKIDDGEMWFSVREVHYRRGKYGVGLLSQRQGVKLPPS
jgi:hypothetical protein